MINYISKKGAIVSLFFLLLSACSIFYLQNSIWHKEANNINIKKLPYQLGDWSGRDVDDLDQRSQNTLKLDQYVRRIYSNKEGRQIFIYIGYWKKQSGDHQAAKHSPLLCLPGNGWKITEVSKHDFEVTKETAEPFILSNSQLIGFNKSYSALFSYWFFSGEIIYREETMALFHIIKQTILNQRSDGGLVELSIDTANNSLALENAQKNLDDFLKALYPALDQLI